MPANGRKPNKKTAQPPGNGENQDSAAESAHLAGLRYVSDTEPGIVRVRRGKGFSYHDQSGVRIEDPATLGRIASLAIPPAWTDVWICASPRGHLQATGRDARDRKQYRYHPRWRDVRDEAKFDRLIAFGNALPAIRRQVDSDLARSGLPREKVLAIVVKLLESTLIRVGNAEYARENHSFGLTTMRTRHVEVNGTEIVFEFVGKGAKKHSVGIHDRRLARLINKLRELPGQPLFQFLDHEKTRHSISSDDVNDYLRQISGEDFTAKDFRTWAGTVLMAGELADSGATDDDNQAKANVVAAIDKVSAQLGNTPTVCRQCYVHPVIIDAYLTGITIAHVRSRKGLDPAEAAVLRLLEQQHDKNL
jgi:DNA topoisomerase-1